LKGGVAVGCKGGVETCFGGDVCELTVEHPHARVGAEVRGMDPASRFAHTQTKKLHTL